MKKIASFILVITIIFAMISPVAAQNTVMTDGGETAEVSNLNMATLPKSENAYILPVFETTDIHGTVADVSSGDPTTYQYRMAYIAKAIRKARKGGSNGSILLDGGDTYQGNVISNIQLGVPVIEILDKMKYDGIALGNHEFDWGINRTTDPDGTMKGYTNASGTDIDSKIPVLACNIYASSPKNYIKGTTKRVNFTKDYEILDKLAVNKKGETISVKVAVIGYVPDYRGSILASKVKNYTFVEDISIPEKIAKRLKANGLCDAAILLAHDEAGSTANALPTDTAFDLVLGGHSHREGTGIADNGVVYLQGASNALDYGYAELCFDKDRMLTAVAENKIINTIDDKEKTYAGSNFIDKEITEICDRAIKEADKVLSDSLGYIVTPATKDFLSVNGVLNYDCATSGNWLADIQNRATGSAASFMNGGGIRTSFPLGDGASSREITVGDIYTIAPFNNELFVYEVTYSEFKEAFDGYLRSILKYADDPDPVLGTCMFGPQLYYTKDAITTIVLKDSAKNDVVIYANGKWKDGYDKEIIRISFNSFLATKEKILKEWNKTDRLVDREKIDNESYIEVLKEEAENTGGLLYIDTNPSIIQGNYSAHTHNYKLMNSVAVAKNITGYNEYQCTICYYSYVDTIVKALADESLAA